MLTYGFYILYGTLATSLFIIGGFFLVTSVASRIEKAKTLKQGYYVHWQPDGAESGTLFYEEGENRLESEFSFYKGNKFVPIIYVPSNEQWKKVMPEWVKERKTEVVERINKHIKNSHFRCKCEDNEDLSRCYWRES